MAENKEIINQYSQENIKSGDIGIIESRKDDIDLDPKVETWLRKVEKITPNDDGIVRDDSTGQAIMMPTVSATPVVQLPITKSAFNQGFGKSIGDAGRWLSTFLFRLIKIKVKTKKATIKFKDES